MESSVHAATVSPHESAGSSTPVTKPEGCRVNPIWGSWEQQTRALQHQGRAANGPHPEPAQALGRATSVTDNEGGWTWTGEVPSDASTQAPRSGRSSDILPVVADAWAVAAFWSGAALLHTLWTHDGRVVSTWWMAVPLVVGMQLLAHAWLGVYRRPCIMTTAGDALRIAVATGAVAVGTVYGTHWIPSWAAANALPADWIIVLCALLGLVLVTGRMMYARRKRIWARVRELCGGQRRYRVALWGPSVLAGLWADTLHNRWPHALRTTWIVDVDDLHAGQLLAGVPVCRAGEFILAGAPPRDVDVIVVDDSSMAAGTGEPGARAAAQACLNTLRQAEVAIVGMAELDAWLAARRRAPAARNARRAPSALAAAASLAEPDAWQWTDVSGKAE